MKKYSRRAWWSLCVLAATLACASPSHAQEFRIGFVNTDRIFKESSTAKLAQSRLEQEFAKREKDLLDLGANLKASADKLEREAPTLSENQKLARQKQVVEMERDFQRKRREFQEDVNSRKSEEFQQVLERANKVVRQIAEAEKYDVVLQEAVYFNAKYDITEKVIKALNAAGSK